LSESELVGQFEQHQAGCHSLEDFLGAEHDLLDLYLTRQAG
jgi:hypothetical protein